MSVSFVRKRRRCARECDPYSSLCENYLSIGLPIRRTLSAEKLPDPILAIVLGYVGRRILFLVRARQETERNSLRVQDEIIGVFDNRLSAVAAALTHMEQGKFNARFFLPEPSDSEASTVPNPFLHGRLVSPSLATNQQLERIFQRISCSTALHNNPLFDSALTDEGHRYTQRQMQILSLERHYQIDELPFA